jgi:hypothetical protein
MEEQLIQLQSEMGEIKEELLTHRQVLQQCLEVRESVMDLLTHRDELVQCLELREGVQAVLSSARVIHEMGDKAAELDLSVAGVSDNTARHGKAISQLMEQQKRTTSIVDAVVRAVKRLDLRRIGRGGRPDTLDLAYGLGTSPAPGEAVAVAAGSTNGMTTRDLGEVTQRPTSLGHNMWEPIGDEHRGGLCATAMDDPIYCSRSSSCTSESRPWQCHPDLDQHQPGAPRELASCVEGVLARIEEALTNLDGGGGPGDSDGCKTGFSDPWHQGRAGDTAATARAGRHGRSRSSGTPVRVARGGTSTRPPPPSGAPPPPEHHPRTRGLDPNARPSDIWRQADSWS